MKKVIYLLVIMGTIFTGCNPLEDINNDLDAQDNPVIGNEVYTLTDDDYDDLGLDFGSFSSEDDARVALPDFIAEMYPYYGNGSSVTINYNLFIGNAFNIRDYNLDQDDYTFSGSNGLGFNAGDEPLEYLADILAANVENPSEGDYRRARYFQYTGAFTIVTPLLSLDQNFDYGATAGDLTTTSGDVWEAHSGAGSGPIGYATTSLSMVDYPSTDIGGALTINGVTGEEDVNNAFTPISTGTVYRSALVNLSAVSTGTYFLHNMDDTFGYSARVGAMDNGAGQILFGIGASSSSLEYGTTAFDLGTTYLLVASYNIETGVSNLYVLTTAEATEPTTPETTNTGNAGLIVQKVGVRQGFGGPTGTMDGIRVANTWSAIMSNEDLPDEIVGDKIAEEEYFEYIDGAWESPSSDFYAITEADFAFMGISSFGSSTPADNYLPVFLRLKYPFAQEGDMIDVGYNYVSSSSGAGARGNLYTFMDGEWVAYQSTVPASLQFGFEDGVWVPDNTIRYTFTSADYAAVGAALLTEPGFAAAAGNLNSFGNFNRTGGSTNWSDDMMVTAVAVVLNSIDPSAEEGQKYIVTVNTYVGSNSTLDVRVIKEGGVWVAN